MRKFYPRLQHYRPGILCGVLLIVLWAVLYSMSSKLLSITTEFSEIVVNGLAYLLAAVILLLIWWWLTGRSPCEIVSPRNAQGRLKLRIIAIPLIMLAFSAPIFAHLLNPHYYQYIGESQIGNRPDELMNPLQRLVGAWLTWLMVPLVEEFILRGIVLHGLLFRHGAMTAIAISSALFAVIHMDVLRLAELFFIGCVLGWLYYATRSLLPCLLVHVTGNLMVFIMPLPFGPSGRYQILLGLLCFPVGLLAIRIINRRLTLSHWQASSDQP